LPPQFCDIENLAKAKLLEFTLEQHISRKVSHIALYFLGFPAGKGSLKVSKKPLGISQIYI
jgi:hypothetical protein